MIIPKATKKKIKKYVCVLDENYFLTDYDVYNFFFVNNKKKTNVINSTYFNMILKLLIFLYKLSKKSSKIVYYKILKQNFITQTYKWRTTTNFITGHG